MANRNFLSQRIYNMHAMAVQLDCQVAIGASGAPTLQSNPGTQLSNVGIQSVTRLAAGIYQIQLQDNYNGTLTLDAQFQSPVTGGAVTAGSFVVGTAYQIVSLGNTNFNAIGLPAGVTAAVGSVFVATGIGAGTGTAKAVGNSGIVKVEQIGQMQNDQPFVSPNGAYIMIQCLGPTDATHTALIPADPANGSVMQIRMLLQNSSIQ